MATSMFTTSRSGVFRTAPWISSISQRRYARRTVHYPGVRGKYPHGTSENGKGWEGIGTREAWRWDKQRRVIESLANVPKKLSYLTKKPIKTWKFPAVMWGSDGLHYQANKTKTNIINDDDFMHNIPVYKDVDVSLAKEKLSPILLETLKLEQKASRYRSKELFFLKNFHSSAMTYAYPSHENHLSHLKTKNILNTIIGTSLTGLFGEFPHLNECSLDEDVTVSAQWARYGVQRHLPFKPPTHPQDRKERPNNALFHAQHLVDFQLRTKLPLQEFYDREGELCRGCTYPQSPYQPTALGQKAESLLRPISSGFNLGSPYEFTHLSVIHTDERHLARAIRDYGHPESTMTGYALTTNFLSSVAQAHMQGFNMFTELKYPFATQTILTNGKTFIFTAYQLNTLLMWRSDEGNNRQNLLWVSKPHSLYDCNEDGSVKSLNEDTLEKLLKFMLIGTSSKRVNRLSFIKSKPPPTAKLRYYIPVKKYIKEIIKKTEIY